MPRYDYICPECLGRVEVFMAYEQVGSVEPWCHHCSMWMVRLITAATVIFKGRGFYCTDNQEEHKKEE